MREKIMLLIVATMFATQPIYNATQAAHALRSDQQITNSKHFIVEHTKHLYTVYTLHSNIIIVHSLQAR